MNFISETVLEILKVRDAVQLYHWQTKSFARHKASDELVDSLTSNMDRFVEAFLGAYPKQKINLSNKSIKFSNYTDDLISIVLINFLSFLETLSLNKHTDLYNIRDDMLSDVHKTLYLFTLN